MVEVPVDEVEETEEEDSGRIDQHEVREQNCSEEVVANQVHCLQ